MARATYTPNAPLLLTNIQYNLTIVGEDYRFQAFILVENIHVPSNKHCLEELNDFKWDKKTNRHHVGKQQYPSSQAFNQKQSEMHRIPIPVWVWVFQVNSICLINACPKGLVKSRDKAQCTLQKKDIKDIPTGQQLKPRLFRACSCRVHHNTRLVPSECHDSNNPISVSQAWPSEQKVCIVERASLFRPQNTFICNLLNPRLLNIAFKSVYLFGRGLARHHIAL